MQIPVEDQFANHGVCFFRDSNDPKKDFIYVTCADSLLMTTDLFDNKIVLS